MKRRVYALWQRISMNIFGIEFKLRIENDCNDPIDGRVFIQVLYAAKCSKTGKKEIWRGRKWYLSVHMTSDEIVKTIWCAFEAAVKHEAMEGFKVDGKVLFNPHVSFEQLLKVSEKEVTRKAIKK